MDHFADRAVARALIVGGGGGWCIFIYSCSARLISFEINLKTTDFKRNPSGITQIFEYTPPPPPPINALATALIAEAADLYCEVVKILPQGVK